MTRNWTRQQYVNEVIDKAGITRPPYHWTRYDCASWLADSDGERPMTNGLPAPETAASAAAALDLLTRYAARVHPSSGPPVNRYQIFANHFRTGVLPSRVAYGAWVKARAGLTGQCADDLDRLTASADRTAGWRWTPPPSVAELAFVLLTQLESGAPVDETIVDTLWSVIDIHGRIRTTATVRTTAAGLCPRPSAHGVGGRRTARCG